MDIIYNLLRTQFSGSGSVCQYLPDTKFECKPYNTYCFYKEERISDIRYLVLLYFCAVCCCIEHLKYSEMCSNIYLLQIIITNSIAHFNYR